MAKKKQPFQAEQLAIADGANETHGTNAPAVPASAPARSAEGGAALPSLVEYAIGGTVWRCARFDALVAEFENGLCQENLALFHQVACSRERSWLLVRRLFAMRPVLQGVNDDLDNLRAWEAAELMERFGLTRLQLQGELDVVRGAWSSLKEQQRLEAEQRREAAEAAARDRERAAALGELNFEKSGLLKRYDFEIQFHTQQEMRWFEGRVTQFEKVLQEVFVQGLGRSALMLELRMRRIDAILNDTNRGKEKDSDWRTLAKQSQDMQGQHQQLVKEILEACPWARQIAGKYAFAGVISDVTRAIAEYQANGDNRLRDGMFTATEIDVELRRSAQTPEPRYRASLPAHVAAARAGLWNPNWESPFTNGQLKRLDEAWKAAFIAAEVQEGVPLVDLESGEFRELKLPSELT